MATTTDLIVRLGIDDSELKAGLQNLDTEISQHGIDINPLLNDTGASTFEEFMNSVNDLSSLSGLNDIPQQFLEGWRTSITSVTGLLSRLKDGISSISEETRDYSISTIAQTLRNIQDSKRLLSDFMKGSNSSTLRSAMNSQYIGDVTKSIHSVAARSSITSGAHSDNVIIEEFLRNGERLASFNATAGIDERQARNLAGAILKSGAVPSIYRRDASRSFGAFTPTTGIVDYNGVIEGLPAAYRQFHKDTALKKDTVFSGKNDDISSAAYDKLYDIILGKNGRRQNVTAIQSAVESGIGGFDKEGRFGLRKGIKTEDVSRFIGSVIGERLHGYSSMRMYTARDLSEDHPEDAYALAQKNNKIIKDTDRIISELSSDSELGGILPSTLSTPVGKTKGAYISSKASYSSRNAKKWFYTPEEDRRSVDLSARKEMYEIPKITLKDVVSAGGRPIKVDPNWKTEDVKGATKGESGFVVSSESGFTHLLGMSGDKSRQGQMIKLDLTGLAEGEYDFERHQFEKNKAAAEALSKIIENGIEIAPDGKTPKKYRFLSTHQGEGVLVDDTIFKRVGGATRQALQDAQDAQIRQDAQNGIVDSKGLGWAPERIEQANALLNFQDFSLKSDKNEPFAKTLDRALKGATPGVSINSFAPKKRITENTKFAFVDFESMYEQINAQARKMGLPEFKHPDSQSILRRDYLADDAQARAPGLKTTFASMNFQEYIEKVLGLSQFLVNGLGMYDSDTVGPDGKVHHRGEKRQIDLLAKDANGEYLYAGIINGSSINSPILFDKKAQDDKYITNEQLNGRFAAMGNAYARATGDRSDRGVYVMNTSKQASYDSQWLSRQAVGRMSFANTMIDSEKTIRLKKEADQIQKAKKAQDAAARKRDQKDLLTEYERSIYENGLAVGPNGPGLIPENLQIFDENRKQVLDMNGAPVFFTKERINRAKKLTENIYNKFGLSLQGGIAGGKTNLSYLLDRVFNNDTSFRNAGNEYFQTFFDSIQLNANNKRNVSIDDLLTYIYGEDKQITVPTPSAELSKAMGKSELGISLSDIQKSGGSAIAKAIQQKGFDSRETSYTERALTRIVRDTRQYIEELKTDDGAIRNLFSGNDQLSQMVRNNPSLLRTNSEAKERVASEIKTAQHNIAENKLFVRGLASGRLAINDNPAMFSFLAKMYGGTSVLRGTEAEQRAILSNYARNIAHVRTRGMSAALAGFRYPLTFDQQYELNNSGIKREDIENGYYANGESLYMSPDILYKMGGGDFDGDVVSLMTGYLTNVVKTTREQNAKNVGGRIVDIPDQEETSFAGGPRKMNTDDIIDNAMRQISGSILMGEASNVGDYIVQLSDFSPKHRKSNFVKNLFAAAVEQRKMYDVDTTFAKTAIAFKKTKAIMEAQKAGGKAFSGIFSSFNKLEEKPTKPGEDPFQDLTTTDQYNFASRYNATTAATGRLLHDLGYGQDYYERLRKANEARISLNVAGSKEQYTLARGLAQAEKIATLVSYAKQHNGSFEIPENFDPATIDMHTIYELMEDVSNANLIRAAIGKQNGGPIISESQLGRTLYLDLQNRVKLSQGLNGALVSSKDEDNIERFLAMWGDGGRDNMGAEERSQYNKALREFELLKIIGATEEAAKKNPNDGTLFMYKSADKNGTYQYMTTSNVDRFTIEDAELQKAQRQRGLISDAIAVGGSNATRLLVNQRAPVVKNGMRAKDLRYSWSMINSLIDEMRGNPFGNGYEQWVSEYLKGEKRVQSSFSADVGTAAHNTLEQYAVQKATGDFIKDLYASQGNGSTLSDFIKANKKAIKDYQESIISKNMTELENVDKPRNGATVAELSGDDLITALENSAATSDSVSTAIDSALAGIDLGKKYRQNLAKTDSVKNMLGRNKNIKEEDIVAALSQGGAFMREKGAHIGFARALSNLDDKGNPTSDYYSKYREFLKDKKIHAIEAFVATDYGVDESGNKLNGSGYIDMVFEDNGGKLVALDFKPIHGKDSSAQDQTKKAFAQVETYNKAMQATGHESFADQIIFKYNELASGGFEDALSKRADADEIRADSDKYYAFLKDVVSKVIVPGVDYYGGAKEAIVERLARTYAEFTGQIPSAKVSAGFDYDRAASTPYLALNGTDPDDIGASVLKYQNLQKESDEIDKITASYKNGIRELEEGEEGKIPDVWSYRALTLQQHKNDLAELERSGASQDIILQRAAKIEEEERALNDFEKASVVGDYEKYIKSATEAMKTPPSKRVSAQAKAYKDAEDAYMKAGGALTHMKIKYGETESARDEQLDIVTDSKKTIQTKNDEIVKLKADERRIRGRLFKDTDVLKDGKPFTTIDDDTIETLKTKYNDALVERLRGTGLTKENIEENMETGVMSIPSGIKAPAKIVNFIKKYNQFITEIYNKYKNNIKAIQTAEAEETAADQRAAMLGIELVQQKADIEEGDIKEKEAMIAKKALQEKISREAKEQRELAFDALSRKYGTEKKRNLSLEKTQMLSSAMSDIDEEESNVKELIEKGLYSKEEGERQLKKISKLRKTAQLRLPFEFDQEKLEALALSSAKRPIYGSYKSLDAEMQSSLGALDYFTEKYKMDGETEGGLYSDKRGNVAYYSKVGSRYFRNKKEISESEYVSKNGGAEISEESIKQMKKDSANLTIDNATKQMDDMHATYMGAPKTLEEEQEAAKLLTEMKTRQEAAKNLAWLAANKKLFISAGKKDEYSKLYSYYTEGIYEDSDSNFARNQGIQQEQSFRNLISSDSILAHTTSEYSEQQKLFDDRTRARQYIEDQRKSGKISDARAESLKQIVDNEFWRKDYEAKASMSYDAITEPISGKTYHPTNGLKAMAEIRDLTREEDEATAIANYRRKVESNKRRIEKMYKNKDGTFAGRDLVERKTSEDQYKMMMAGLDASVDTFEENYKILSNAKRTGRDLSIASQQSSYAQAMNGGFASFQAISDSIAANLYNQAFTTAENMVKAGMIKRGGKQYRDLVGSTARTEQRKIADETARDQYEQNNIRQGIYVNSDERQRELNRRIRDKALERYEKGLTPAQLTPAERARIRDVETFNFNTDLLEDAAVARDNSIMSLGVEDVLASKRGDLSYKSTQLTVAEIKNKMIKDLDNKRKRLAKNGVKLNAQVFKDIEEARESILSGAESERIETYATGLAGSTKGLAGIKYRNYNAAMTEGRMHVMTREDYMSRAQNNRQHELSKMLQDGLITKEQYDSATNWNDQSVRDAVFAQATRDYETDSLNAEKLRHGAETQLTQMNAASAGRRLTLTERENIIRGKNRLARQELFKNLVESGQSDSVGRLYSAYSDADRLAFIQSDDALAADKALSSTISQSLNDSLIYDAANARLHGGYTYGAPSAGGTTSNTMREMLEHQNDARVEQEIEKLGLTGTNADAYRNTYGSAAAGMQAMLDAQVNSARMQQENSVDRLITNGTVNAAPVGLFSSYYAQAENKFLARKEASAKLGETITALTQKQTEGTISDKEQQQLNRATTIKGRLDKIIERDTDEKTGELNTGGKVRGILGAIGSRMSYMAVRKIIQTVVKTIKQAIAAAKEADQMMTSLQMEIPSLDDEGAEKTLNRIRNVSSKLGVATKEVFTAYMEMISDGFDQVFTEENIEKVMKISKTTGMKTKDINKILKAYMDSIFDSTEVFNAINSMGSFATDKSADIATAFSKMKTVNTNTISARDLSTTFAVATNGGVSGDVAGTVVNEIAERLRKVSAGQTVKNQDGTVSNLSDVLSALSKAGVSIYDVSGQLKNVFSLMQDLGKVWNNISQKDQSAISTALGGVQANNVGSLANAFAQTDANGNYLSDIYQEEASKGESIDSEYEDYLDSLNAKITELKDNWGEFLSSLIPADWIEAFSSAIDSAVVGLNKMPAALRTILTLVSTIGGIILGIIVTKAVAKTLEKNAHLGYGVLPLLAGVGTALLTVGAAAATVGWITNAAAGDGEADITVTQTGEKSAKQKIQDQTNSIINDYNRNKEEINGIRASLASADFTGEQNVNKFDNAIINLAATFGITSDVVKKLSGNVDDLNSALDQLDEANEQYLEDQLRQIMAGAEMVDVIKQALDNEAIKTGGYSSEAEYDKFYNAFSIKHLFNLSGDQYWDNDTDREALRGIMRAFMPSAIERRLKSGDLVSTVENKNIKRAKELFDDAETDVTTLRQYAGVLYANNYAALLRANGYDPLYSIGGGTEPESYTSSFGTDFATLITSDDSSKETINPIIAEILDQEGFIEKYGSSWDTYRENTEYNTKDYGLTQLRTMAKKGDGEISVALGKDFIRWFVNEGVEEGDRILEQMLTYDSVSGKNRFGFIEKGKNRVEYVKSALVQGGDKEKAQRAFNETLVDEGFYTWSANKAKISDIISSVGQSSYNETLSQLGFSNSDISQINDNIANEVINHYIKKFKEQNPNVTDDNAITTGAIDMLFTDPGAADVVQEIASDYTKRISARDVETLYGKNGLYTSENGYGKNKGFEYFIKGDDGTYYYGETIERAQQLKDKFGSSSPIYFRQGDDEGNGIIMPVPSSSNKAFTNASSQFDMTPYVAEKMIETFKDKKYTVTDNSGAMAAADTINASLEANNFTGATANAILTSKNVSSAMNAMLNATNQEEFDTAYDAWISAIGEASNAPYYSTARVMTQNNNEEYAMAMSKIINGKFAEDEDIGKWFAGLSPTVQAQMMNDNPALMGFLDKYSDPNSRTGEQYKKDLEYIKDTMPTNAFIAAAQAENTFGKSTQNVIAIIQQLSGTATQASQAILSMVQNLNQMNQTNELLGRWTIGGSANMSSSDLQQLSALTGFSVAQIASGKYDGFINFEKQRYADAQIESAQEYTDAYFNSENIDEFYTKNKDGKIVATHRGNEFMNMMKNLGYNITLGSENDIKNGKPFIVTGVNNSYQQGNSLATYGTHISKDKLKEDAVLLFDAKTNGRNVSLNEDGTATITKKDGTKVKLTKDTVDQLSEQYPDLKKYLSLNDDEVSSKNGQALETNIEIQFAVEGLEDLETLGEILPEVNGWIEKLEKGGIFNFDFLKSFRSTFRSDRQLADAINAGKDMTYEQASIIADALGITTTEFYDNKEKYIGEASEYMRLKQIQWKESTEKTLNATEDKATIKSIKSEVEQMGGTVSGSAGAYTITMNENAWKNWTYKQEDPLDKYSPQLSTRKIADMQKDILSAGADFESVWDGLGAEVQNQLSGASSAMMTYMKLLKEGKTNTDEFRKAQKDLAVEVATNYVKSLEEAGVVTQGLSSTVESLLKGTKAERIKANGELANTTSSYAQQRSVFTKYAKGQTLTKDEWSILGSIIGEDNMVPYMTGTKTLSVSDINEVFGQQVTDANDKYQAFKIAQLYSVRNTSIPNGTPAAIDVEGHAATKPHPKDINVANANIAEERARFEAQGWIFDENDQIVGLDEDKYQAYSVSSAKNLNSWFNEQQAAYNADNQIKESDYTKAYDKYNKAPDFAKKTAAGFSTWAEINGMLPLAQEVLSDERILKYGFSGDLALQIMQEKGYGQLGFDYESYKYGEDSKVTDIINKLLSGDTTAIKDLENDPNKDARLAAIKQTIGEDEYNRILNAKTSEEQTAAIAKANKNLEQNLLGEDLYGSKYADEIISAFLDIQYGTDAQRQNKLLSFESEMQQRADALSAVDAAANGDLSDTVINMIASATGKDANDIKKDFQKDSVAAKKKYEELVKNATSDTVGIIEGLITSQLKDLDLSSANGVGNSGLITALEGLEGEVDAWVIDLIKQYGISLDENGNVVIGELGAGDLYTSAGQQITDKQTQEKIRIQAVQGARDAIALGQDAINWYLTDTTKDNSAFIESNPLLAYRMMEASNYSAYELNRSLSQYGNVNLTDRQLIDAETMRSAGWTDFEEGQGATVYSQAGTFEDAGGKQYVISYTPILEDGTVLSPEAAADYIQGLIGGDKDLTVDEILARDAEGQGIIMKTGIVDEQNTEEKLIDEANQYGVDVHNAQEALYTSSMTQEEQEAMLALADQAILGNSDTIFQQEALLKMFFGENLEHLGDEGTWQELMSDATKKPYIESLLEQYPELKEIKDSFTDAAPDDATIDAVERFNAQFAADKAKQMSKYGSNAEQVSSYMDDIAKGGQKATKAVGQLTSQINKSAYQNGLLQGISGSGKTGSQLTAEEKTALAENTGLDENAIENMSADQIQSWVDKGINNIDLDFTGYAEQIVAQLNAAFQALPQDKQIEIGAAIHSSIRSDGTVDIDALMAAVKGVDDDLYNALAVYNGTGAELELKEYLNENGFGYMWELIGAKSGSSGKGGGGGGGGKSKADKLLEAQKRKKALYDHLIKMVQYQETKYQNAGELTNYGKMLEKENEIRATRGPQIQEDIDEIRSLMATTKAESDDWYKLRDALMALEEEEQENNNAIAENTKKLKENQEEIRKVTTSLKDAIREVAENEEAERRNELAATVELQNTILEAIKQRYQDEWDLVKEDLNRKKQALQEELSMIDERLNKRKEAADEAEKFEELAELRRQYALISIDEARSRDAAEIAEKIKALEEEIAWDIAEDEAEAQKKAIENESDSIDTYMQQGDEYLQNLLEDANNFTDEVNTVMAMSQEDLLNWLKDNNKEYIHSLQEAQQQMLDSWTDTYNKMMAIVERYAALIETLINGTKEEYLTYMQEHYTDGNGKMWEDLTPEEAGSMLYEWEELWDNNVAAYLDYATWDHSDDFSGISGKTTTTTPSNTPKTEPQDVADGIDKSHVRAVLDAGLQIVDGLTVKIGQVADNIRKITEERTLYPVAVLNSEYETVYESIKDKIKTETKVPKNAEGGLVDYTGLAWVDGTYSNPEAFLDATDTKLIRRMIDVFSYVSVPSAMNINQDGIYGGSSSIGSVNITLNEAQFNTDDDYDLIAQKVGESFTRELSKQGLSTININF